MKHFVTLTTLLLFISPAFFSAQTADSIDPSVSLDSLISLVKDLAYANDYEEALRINRIAEKIALDNYGEESLLIGKVFANYGRIDYYQDNYEDAENWYQQAGNIFKKKLGKEDILYTNNLWNIGNVHYYNDQYKKAEKYFLEVKEIMEELPEKDELDYAGVLSDLASVYYWGTEEYEKVETLLLKALGIREEKLGTNHPDYATICNDLGNLYSDLKDYEKSENYYLKAKEIWSKDPGIKSTLYEISINNLAVLYDDLNAFEKEGPLLEESLKIMEANYGKESIEYAKTLEKLGGHYLTTEQYSKAEPALLRAIEIKEKTIGKEHEDYVTSLDNLGDLYDNMGLYPQSEKYYLQSFEVTEKLRGKYHSDYADCLNNLGIIYWKKGAYDKAETFYLEAIQLWETLYGKKHENYGKGCNNLGNLYSDIGEYEKAQEYYTADLKISAKIYGKKHPDYAESLSNLGVLYSDMEKNDKAEKYYLEALSIREKVLGKNHSDYAASLDNLAILYDNQGKHDKAEAMYLQARAIKEKVYGKEHPDYANSLFNLGSLYKEVGDLKKAVTYYLECKTIRKKTLGNKHPDYNDVLTELRDLYWELEDFEKSKSYLQQSNEIQQALLRQASHHLSEKELSTYIQDFISEQDVLFSFGQLRQGLSEESYNNSLFYKGFLLNDMAQLRQLASKNPETRQTYQELKLVQLRLSKEYTKPIDEQIEVKHLEEKANVLEKELSRRVSGFGETIKEVDWKAVQASLKPGEASIEFIYYNFYNPELTDSTFYGALIIKPELEKPIFKGLFEVEFLDSLISVDQKRKADYVNSLYSSADRGFEEETQKMPTLYELIWKPLEQDLKAIKTIYYAPVGLLHRLNLGAISPAYEETIADRHKLIRVNSTRQLVLPHEIKDPGDFAMLYGGVDYEIKDTISTENQGAEITSRGYTTTEESKTDKEYSNALLRGGGWGYLQGTEKEVTEIDATMERSGFNVSLLKGVAATEESFKAIGQSGKSPKILHIATHGFFFPEPAEDENPGKEKEEAQQLIFKISPNPMIRSGILLAGGNYAWKTGKPINPDKEDGIVTAFEISQMNLSNTELVVLSACETGLGDIEGDEGVYGLQRAFKIAGVKYLIMSLWQVPDRQTSILMKKFYQKWLEDGMELPEAFRAAQQELREFGFDPYQWAGFVLIQ